MNNKICIECQGDKTCNEYYMYKTKKTIKYYQKCKDCHNKNQTKYEKKSTGFNKLPIDIREKIVELLKIRKVKLIHIASAYHIDYGSLCYWSRNSLIV